MIEHYKNFSLENLPYINLEGLICWEEFRDIPDYEGIYQVSDLGRVKSLKFGKEKILKSKKDKYGYLCIGLCKNGNQKMFTVHQLVAMAFLNHTPCRHKWVVNHKNFIKTNNYLENLEIVTARENCNQKHIKSSSTLVGVNWHKCSKKWTSQIAINGKIKWLGSFDTEEEASQYYENAVIAIENGTEVKVKSSNFTSKYKGVSWNNKRNIWVVHIWRNGKGKYVGQSIDEEKAHQIYENYKKEIKE